MNSPSDTSPLDPLDSQPVAPVPMSETRPMYWSVRREMWENRSIYIAPLVVAAVVLFGSFVSTTVQPKRIRTASPIDAAKHRAKIAKPFLMAPAPIILTALLVGVFYSLDALYGERRDRSILFWKSLPVSDMTTVLSKASIPLAVLPMIAIALGLTTQLLLLLLSTPVLLWKGVNPARMWAELFVGEPLVMLYGVTAHVLWFAPIYGWLLLVSAWARRTPLLWAVLPVLVASLFERMAFRTSYFGSMLKYRVVGAMAEAFAYGGQGNDGVIHVWHLTPVNFLSSAGLWFGLLFAAAFLAFAVRLRRNREPI